MFDLFRTSLAARSTAAVLAIVALVGLLFLAVALPLTLQFEEQRQHTQLVELLNTVEDSVSIACFLADGQMAGEIAEGLLSNRTVREVTIFAAGAELARRVRPDDATREPPVAALMRNVESPFTPGEIVGSIALAPDAGEIRNNVWQSVRIIVLLVLVQVIITGIGVTLAVNRYIARPTARLSRALHALQAEAGEKLTIPRGNESDEIGQLTHDINAMAGNVWYALHQERKLRQEHEIESLKFRAIFEHADSGIFLVDGDGMLISANPAFARLFNVPQPATNAWSALRFSDLCTDNRDDVADLLVRCSHEKHPMAVDLKVGGRPGLPTRWISVVLNPLDDGNLQGVANDVTAHKKAELAAQTLAATDRLTGLGNRLGFEQQLTDLMERSYREKGYRFTLLMMDLDYFKQVNDTFGHKAGDEVLVQVARRLEQVVRRSDFVGRLGGDEFVILLDETVDRTIVEKILNKIIAAVGEPIKVADGALARVGTSLGAVVFDDPNVSHEELVRRADEAMYAAKRAGRNTFHIYT